MRCLFQTTLHAPLVVAARRAKLDPAVARAQPAAPEAAVPVYREVVAWAGGVGRALAGEARVAVEPRVAVRLAVAVGARGERAAEARERHG